MSIATAAELRVALGLTSSITSDEDAWLTMVHPVAEGKVKSHLQYDPVQQEHTEYYPRHFPRSGYWPVRGTWDVNAQRTQAKFEAENADHKQTLQLQHLPVRAVSDVRVDYDARHGQQSGAFASATQWTAGDDYWLELDESNLSRSGMLFANGAWPYEPGTVRVTYTAGYSDAELRGQATADVESGGVYTTAGVDASPIRWAVILTMQQAFLGWDQRRKDDRRGFKGPIVSERAQDYQYSLGSGASNAAAMIMQLPAEAVDALEPFRNYGSLRL